MTRPRKIPMAKAEIDFGEWCWLKRVMENMQVNESLR